MLSLKRVLTVLLTLIYKYRLLTTDLLTIFIPILMYLLNSCSFNRILSIGPAVMTKSLLAIKVFE